MPVTNRKVNISKRYSPEEREAIAFDIISFIQERSKDGKGKDGKKFPKYSKDYTGSLDFKNAGKSKSRVDLTLSGDMLDSIDLLSDTAGSLTIGIDGDDEAHGRAEGNIRGSYGKSTGSKSKARDFLALSRTEINTILKNYPIDDEEKREEQVVSFFAAMEAAKKLLPKKERESATIGKLIL